VKRVSDEAETGNLKLEIRLVDFTGKVLWQPEKEFGVLSQELIFPIREILGKYDPASVVLVSVLKNRDEIVDADLHYFVKPKDLKLTDPGIETEIIEKPGVIEVKLTSKYLAKNVFLHTDKLEEQFSDNYFDILPGETVSVTIPKNGFETEATKTLEVMHLYKTYVLPLKH
jgi:beta-mannosidase